MNKLGAGSVVRLEVGTVVVPAGKESVPVALTAPAHFELLEDVDVGIVSTANGVVTVLPEGPISLRTVGELRAEYADESGATFERAAGGLAVSTASATEMVVLTASGRSDAALRAIAPVAATAAGPNWKVIGGVASGIGLIALIGWYINRRLAGR